MLLNPERLAEQPFQPAATDSVAMFPGNTQAESRPPLFIPNSGIDQQLPIAGPTTGGVDPIEVPLMAKTTPGSETVVVKWNGHWVNP